MSWESPIIRISTGRLNTVNDTVIANQAGVSGSSKFGGQLGKTLGVDSSQIGQMQDTTVGTLFAGLYQYVRLAAGSAAIAVGEVLYWDQSVAANLFQVSRTATSGVTLTASAVAGIALNVITPGNYGFIFVGPGQVQALYVASITGTKATGRPVFVSRSTVNRVDVIDSDPSTTEIWNTYLGWAVGLPTDNSLGTISMSPRPLRG